MGKLITLFLSLLLAYACNNTIEREEEDRNLEDPDLIEREEEDPSKGFVQRRAEKAVRNQEANFEGTPELKSKKR